MEKYTLVLVASIAFLLIMVFILAYTTDKHEIEIAKCRQINILLYLSIYENSDNKDISKNKIEGLIFKTESFLKSDFEAIKGRLTN